MIIDTHAHLNFKAFEKDADEVIRRCLDQGVWVINVGSQLQTSKRAVELAEKYLEGVYASIGLHPIHVSGVASLIKNRLDPEESATQQGVGEFRIEDYWELASRLIGDPPKRRVVAIGEIGLDYYYKPKTKAKLENFKMSQKEVFLKQLELAQELNLPVIFHCRSAHQDLIEILKSKCQNLNVKSNPKSQFQNNKLRGVIHCFTGNTEQMRQYLGIGLYLGFNGIIFRQIQGIDWQEIISKAPLDRILVETDAPYLTPPQEGQKRNEPIFVKYVAEEIARIKKLSYQEILEATTSNARKLFEI